MRRQYPAFLPLVILIAAGTASAQIIHVPGDYATIGDALAHTYPQNEVHVAPGTYFEQDLAIPFFVTLKGTGASPSDVVIDAQGQGRVLLTTEYCWIENLKLTGGNAVKGGGLAVIDGHAVLTDVEIAACTANLGGGVIVRGGGIEMIRCVLTENEAYTAGGGLFTLNAPNVSLLDCALVLNRAGAYGGAWSAARSAVAMDGCTVAENQVHGWIHNGYQFRSGLGAEGAAFDGMGVAIARSVSSANAPDGGYVNIESVLATDAANTVETSCSLRWQPEYPGWPGYLADQLGDPVAGNIDADPRFCREPGGLAAYFGIGADSPCLPANSGGCGLIGAFGQACGVTPAPDTPAAVFALHPAYPNPFNPKTTIDYAIERSGPVTLVVYGLDGRRVATLVNEDQAAGSHSATWVGLDDRGRSVASGVYLCRLRTADRTAAIRMTLVK